MLRYIIFILIFNVLSFQAQNFDIYEIRDRKPVENSAIKREIFKEIREQNIIEIVKKDLKEKGNVTVANVSTKNQTVEESKKDDKAIKHDETTDKTDVGPENKNISETSKKVKESKKNSTESTLKHPKHAAIDHPGAVWRGFYVFLGLSFLIIIYFVIKAFRLRPGAPPPATVRKYGIVGRRSDMEMLPLPLAEEDDDDTLFDMGTQVNR